MSRIVVVSPAPIKGSGGIRTLLSYAKALADSGHEVLVSFIDDGAPLGGNLSHLIEQQYGISGLAAGVFPAGLEKADLAIATRWDTPSAIRDHFTSGKVVHLIQDIEGWFSPVGDTSLIAENNFLFDTKFITLGNWLAKKQQMDYGEPAYTMNFGYDTETYYVNTPYEARDNRVCFIYQPEKPRRCTKIGLEALGLVKAARPDCEIVLYGNDAPADLWYPVTNLGIVPPSALNQLYNNSRVGLCISASNPSRIPFEMTACGLPVVDIFRANNLHDYAEGNGVLLAHQTPEALAKAILTILDEDRIGMAMSHEATTFAANRSLAQEMEQFVSYVEKILNGETAPTRTDLEPLYRGNPVQSSTYSAARTQAFCKRQLQEFSVDTTVSAPVIRAPKNHGQLMNVVPLDVMLAARPTCEFPPNLGWEPISFPQDNILQTHPVTNAITSVVLPHAIPAAVKQIIATVRVANPQAAKMEFAMAVREAQQDPDAIFLPGNSVWKGRNGSGWIPVTPGSDQALVMELPVASRSVSDLHLAVRAAKGNSIDFGWCQWLSFSYLQAETEGA